MKKVNRWALYLSLFLYKIDHTPGDFNLMADIMNRLIPGYRGVPAIVCKVSRELEKKVISTEQGGWRIWVAYREQNQKRKE